MSAATVFAACPLFPVILGLVPRTPVSTELPPQGSHGVDERWPANDSAGARGVLGTSPRMTGVGDANVQGREVRP
jgi:hypothetical protein